MHEVPEDDRLDEASERLEGPPGHPEGPREGSAVPPEPSSGPLEGHGCPGGSGKEGGEVRGAPGAQGDSATTGDNGRRTFLTQVSLVLGAAIGTALAVPWLAVFLNPIQRRDPELWREVGSVDDFPVGETIQATYVDAQPLPWAGFAARSAAWVRRGADDAFVAFTSYCTHVGCPIRWEPGAELFLCPCHGGAFYPDGSVAAGPPPRPLDRHPIRVRNGIVEIQALGVPPPGGADRSARLPAAPDAPCLPQSTSPPRLAGE